MAAELNFKGMGLDREDEIFARVVVDLGLAKSGDVVKAVTAELGKWKGRWTEPEEGQA